MRGIFILFTVFFFPLWAQAQVYTSYEKPIALMLYSQILEDSVEIELCLPKGMAANTKSEYPIIYLLDRQLQNNYQYNLATIDYLSSLQWMPQSILVGITFPWKSRGPWTVPNASGGKADDFILFLKEELNKELQAKYPLSNFNLLIGHSRSAIFSSYALSKHADFFNGAIASSVSKFDFGDSLQEAQFVSFLKQIETSEQNYYYHFSVGEESYGDLHEASVEELNHFLQSISLAKNFKWKYYKHQVAHDLSPGLTVGKALSEIFKEYGRRIDRCFAIAAASPQEVPWEEFENVYTSISSELGLRVEPSDLFYNSIASAYYNDYDGIYGDQHLPFALEILVKALEAYPGNIDYLCWIGEIHYLLKEPELAEPYLKLAEKLLDENPSLTRNEKVSYLEEIERIKKIH